MKTEERRSEAESDTGSPSVKGPGAALTDERLDKVLLEMFKKDEPEPELEPEPEPAPAKAVEPEKEQPAEPGPAPEAGADDEPSAEPQVDREVLRKSLNALRRAKLDPDVIAGMDNQTVISLGSNFADVQSESDRRYKALEQEVRELKEAGQRREEPSGAVPAGEPSSDLMAAAQPLAEDLGLDEGGQKRLAELIALAAGQNSGASTRAEAGLFEMAFETVRQRLGSKEIPKLLEAETWGKVRTMMDAQVKTELYSGEDLFSNVERLIRDSARLVDAAVPSSGTDTEIDEELERRIRNGQPSKPTRQRSERTLTGDERETAVATAIVEAEERGEVLTPADITKRFGSKRR